MFLGKKTDGTGTASYESLHLAYTGNLDPSLEMFS